MVDARVDLAKIRDGLAFPPAEARLISGYWRQQLLDVCDYAETLAAENARLKRDRGRLINSILICSGSCGWGLGDIDPGIDPALAANPQAAPAPSGGYEET